MTIIGEQVMAARKLLRWTQLGLAMKAGVSETTVGRIETGDLPILEPMVVAIRAALELAGVEFTNSGRPGVLLKTAGGTMRASWYPPSARWTGAGGGHVAEGQMSVTPAQVIAARKQLGWSQTRLAGPAGLNGGTISKFEMGVRHLPVTKVAAIRAALESAGIEFTENGAKFRREKAGP